MDKSTYCVACDSDPCRLAELMESVDRLHEEGAGEGADGKAEPDAADEKPDKLHYEFEVSPDEAVLLREAERKRRVNRIEALRAASRVVAGLVPLRVISTAGRSLTEDELLWKNWISDPKTTILFAEQFARWLETGER